MKFVCQQCHRISELEADAIVCPYCAAPYDADKQAGHEVAKAIYNTLGRKQDLIEDICRLLRRELNAGKGRCMLALSFNAEQEQAISFTDEYEKLQDCSSTDGLFKKLDALLAKVNEQRSKAPEELRDKINQQNRVDAKALPDKMAAAQKAICVAYEIANVPCSFAPYVEPILQYDVQIDQPDREYIDRLAKAVDSLYDRFKQIVKENGLFAAFAHDSGYGGAAEPWYVKALRTLGDDESGDEEPGNKKAAPERTLQEIVQAAEAAVAKPYISDFFATRDLITPHIAAFWEALEQLITLSDKRITIKSLYNGEECSEESAYKQAIDAVFADCDEALYRSFDTMKEREEHTLRKTLGDLKEYIQIK